MAATMVDVPERLAAAKDVVHILGDLDRAVLFQILALRPTVRDAEEASQWLGDGPDVFDFGRASPATSSRLLSSARMIRPACDED